MQIMSDITVELCDFVGVVTICKSFTKHGTNNVMKMRQVSLRARPFYTTNYHSFKAACPFTHYLGLDQG
jgi:hypothetical protein